MTTTFIYTSPLRPLDIGFAARQGGVEIDWDHTDIEPGWTPAKRYAFSGLLPEFMVEQMTLERLN